MLGGGTLFKPKQRRKQKDKQQMKTVIHETLLRLSSAPQESHVKIRQELYNTLKLPFEKQLALYTHVLGPVSSGQLSSNQSLTRAVGDAERIILNNK